MKSLINSPALLTRAHDRASFDCGVIELNEYLKKYALQNQKKNAARTYVATIDNRIVGYYSLAYGSVFPSEVPKDISAGLGKYPIPILLLARLAVNLTEKGKGLGKALLKDALLRSAQAAEIAGLRAVVVHAKDANAKAFYERFGFEPAPQNDCHLFLMTTNIIIF